MALTPSQTISLHTLAPEFTLIDSVSKQALCLQEAKGKHGTIILFICNHCPFVVHINPTLVALAKEYQGKGIAFIAISSNDVVKYPMDGPEQMKVQAIKEGYSFPYLYDETQEVAQAYGATCTPDVFIYDEHLKLYYHGQLDDSRPGNGIECDGQDLKNAFDNLLSGLPTHNQKPSIGCNIKWK